jgi:hypothetical protein
VSDLRLREAQRRASTGGVADEAALIVERLRVGTLTRERLELAAFCGHAAAQAALGWPGDGQVWSARGWRGNYEGDFGGWVRDLTTWVDAGPVPGWVLVYAASTAAEAAMPAARDDEAERCHQCRRGERHICDSDVCAGALGAIKAWLRVPTPDYLETWRTLRSVVAGFDDGYTVPNVTERAWVPHPAILDRSTDSGWFEESVAECARRFVGEPETRKAIQDALTLWALS